MSPRILWQSISCISYNSLYFHFPSSVHPKILLELTTLSSICVRNVH